MAKLSKAEFAEKCGIETKKLSVYIQRKKVVLTTEGEIDDTNAINVQFWKHQIALSKLKKVAVKDVEEHAAGEEGAEEVAAVDVPEKKKRHKVESEPDQYDFRFDLDTKKKQAEIKKLEIESSNQQMRQAKMLGQLIPTDLVKSLFAQHFKDVTISFKQSIDIFLTEIGKKAKLGRNEHAEMKGQLIRIINNAVEESVIQSKKSIENIVKEYSHNSK